jgi:hypothetical protein
MQKLLARFMEAETKLKTVPCFTGSPPILRKKRH